MSVTFEFSDIIVEIMEPFLKIFILLVFLMILDLSRTSYYDSFGLKWHKKVENDQFGLKKVKESVEFKIFICNILVTFFQSFQLETRIKETIEYTDSKSSWTSVYTSDLDISRDSWETNAISNSEMLNYSD